MNEALALEAQQLADWYLSQKRSLPWREDRDPYRIWISEVMLQQTTVTAVIPYYLRFLQKFPNISSLADAPIEEVLEQWSGLGYYSRARNLHKAAGEIARRGFPKKFEELLELPGFGQYTSRAVASLAFDEKVGVLDGNVIRILTRRFGLGLPWWESRAKMQLQEISDRLAGHGEPAIVNQAMMELGATICTPQSPTCLLCPWAKQCKAFSSGNISKFPQKKPRRMREIWLWEAQIFQDKGKIALQKNNYAPFLRNQLILPGKVLRMQKKPETYSYRGSVTHHDIFVDVRPAERDTASNLHWVVESEVKKISPSSLMTKAFIFARKSGLLSIVFLLLVSACGSKPSKPAITLPLAPIAVEKNKGVAARAVNPSGDCYEPSFSPDGNRTLYLCRNRPAHQQPQVYEFDLKSQREKRITFHDGEDFAPSYAPDGKRILYASSTDEIKEDLEAISDYKERVFHRAKTAQASLQPQTEVYLASLNGAEIQRLTSSDGYDSEAQISSDSKQIVFVSERLKLGSTQIFLADLIDGRTPKRSHPLLLNTPAPTTANSPQFSPDGKKLLFVLQLPDSKRTQIFIMNLRDKKMLPITSGLFFDRHPVWNPKTSEIVFSSDRFDHERFELWAVRPDGQCFRRLTRSEGNKDYPAISPDGKQLLFDWVGPQNKSVYLMPNPEAQASDCQTERPE